MSVSLSRWIPVSIAAVVVAAGAIAVPIAANAAVSLTPKSAEQVLAMIGNSKTDAFSGKLSSVSNLGLPSLPAGMSSGSASGVSSILSLLSSPQSARIYVDGTSKERVQVLSNLAEQDVIRNGNDVWQYDSKKNTVSHTILTPHSGSKAPTRAPAQTQTPAQIAHQLVTHLDASTTLSVGTSAQVAGRNTYTLVLTPKASDTLIGSVSISVDAATGLPLAVDATARGQKDPALGVAFTDIQLGAPDASLFTFTTPKGAKVTTNAAPKPHTSKKPAAGATPAKPTVVGSGWDAVVETAASANTSGLTSQKLFTELTTAVTGGRVLHTSVANILITTDGRVLAGSVSVSRLLEVAAQK